MAQAGGEEQLYEAKCILRESDTKYCIQWVGTDAEGTPWLPTWEPKEYANRELIREWEARKAWREALSPAEPEPRLLRRKKRRKETKVASPPLDAVDRRSRSQSPATASEPRTTRSKSQTHLNDSEASASASTSDVHRAKRRKGRAPSVGSTRDLPTGASDRLTVPAVHERHRTRATSRSLREASDASASSYGTPVERETARTNGLASRDTLTTSTTARPGRLARAADSGPPSDEGGGERDVGDDEEATTSAFSAIVKKAVERVKQDVRTEPNGESQTSTTSSSVVPDSQSASHDATLHSSSMRALDVVTSPQQNGPEEAASRPTLTTTADGRPLRAVPVPAPSDFLRNAQRRASPTGAASDQLEPRIGSRLPSSPIETFTQRPAPRHSTSADVGPRGLPMLPDGSRRGAPLPSPAVNGILEAPTPLGASIGGPRDLNNAPHVDQDLVRLPSATGYPPAPGLQSGPGTQHSSPVSARHLFTSSQQVPSPTVAFTSSIQPNTSWAILQASNIELQALADEFRARNQILERAAASQKQAIISTQQLLEDEMARSKQIEQTLQSTQDDVAALHKTQQTLQAKNVELANDVEFMRQQYEKASSAHSERVVQVRDLQTEVSSLRRQLEVGVKQVQELASAKIRKLEETLKRDAARTRLADDRASAAAAQLEKEFEAVERLTRQVGDLQERLVRAHAQLRYQTGTDAAFPPPIATVSRILDDPSFADDDDEDEDEGFATDSEEASESDMSGEYSDDDDDDDDDGGGVRHPQQGDDTDDGTMMAAQDEGGSEVESVYACEWRRAAGGPCGEVFTQKGSLLAHLLEHGAGKE